jgi:Undecaprenyl-phosphate glucose phosphotransferase
MAYGSDVGDKSAPLDGLSRSTTTCPKEVVPVLLSTVDAAIILISIFVGGIGYHLFLGSAGNATADSVSYCAVGLLAGLLYTLRMKTSGHYGFPDSAKPGVEIGEILVCWFTTGLLLAFIAFLLKVGVDFSRGAFVISYFLTPVGLIAARKLSKIALAGAISRGTFGRSDSVLLGDSAELAALGQKDFLAFFGTANINRFTLGQPNDPLGRSEVDSRTMNSVVNFVRSNNCRELLLALPWDDAERIEFVRDQVKALPVTVRLLPDRQVRSLSQFATSARQQIMTIEIQRAPLSGPQRLVKRCIDVVVSFLALVFFLPIMVLTAISIKFDSPGPVIFRQSRKGFNGRQFVIYKFRTMTVEENGPVVSQATRDDPRVTAIGRLLRSASIDELPQLFNVLKGDMSLIGPRPHALAHDDYFQNLLSDYAFRHHVKPGITGWAQCNGARGATPSIEHISERVKLDLWYINNWSLWLDIQILIKTCFEVLRKRNAY